MQIAQFFISLKTIATDTYMKYCVDIQDGRSKASKLYINRYKSYNILELQLNVLSKHGFQCSTEVDKIILRNSSSASKNDKFQILKYDKIRGSRCIKV